MEGSAMALIAGAIGIGLGAAIGLIIGKSKAQPDTAKTDALENEITRLNDEHQQYREQVDAHFNKSSDLIVELTQNYRNVYAHLSDGARNLCLTTPSNLDVELPSGSIYEAEAEKLAHASEDNAATAETASTEKPAAQASDTGTTVTETAATASETTPEANAVEASSDKETTEAAAAESKTANADKKGNGAAQVETQSTEASDTVTAADASEAKAEVKAESPADKSAESTEEPLTIKLGDVPPAVAAVAGQKTEGEKGKQVLH
jgi:uncharacterized membrane-anchored protein YhcB (DUF1043 family)